MHMPVSLQAPGTTFFLFLSVISAAGALGLNEILPQSLAIDFKGLVFAKC